jgi:hypothetical protein
MPSRFAMKLASLGFRLPDWCKAPCELLVLEFEKRFALALPPDYREFLVQHGGVIGSAICAFQEPTPCGSGTCVDCFYGFALGDRRVDLARATELIDGAPDVVAIGSNLAGAMFWLKCFGHDRGHVYMDDTEGRSAWPDEMFYERFANLSPTIKEYLSMRKRGELPEKPGGYEHVYRLATSFEEFVERLQWVEEWYRKPH